MLKQQMVLQRKCLPYALRCGRPLRFDVKIQNRLLMIHRLRGLVNAISEESRPARIIAKRLIFRDFRAPGLRQEP
jgi:hypothetical protein